MRLLTAFSPKPRSDHFIGKIKDACVRNSSGSVCMFIDETQRLGENEYNEYEWLRDVSGQQTALFLTRQACCIETCARCWGFARVLLMTDHWSDRV